MAALGALAESSRDSPCTCAASQTLHLMKGGWTDRDVFLVLGPDLDLLLSRGRYTKVNGVNQAGGPISHN